MANFITTDRKTNFLLPPSVEDWVPENHLARFIVEAIDGMALVEFTREYKGAGSQAHHPATLLAILIYGYATGVFSSRKLERATYDSVVFRFIAANTHPDHSTLAGFRNRFHATFEQVFIEVLRLAKELKVAQFAKLNLALDGTKIQANASRHSALSHGHIETLEALLKAQVQDLIAQAEKADQSDVPEGVDLPKEIERRQERLAAMATAKAKIAERAEERYPREKTEYDQKMQRRATKETLTGKKVGGKPPRAPEPGPRASDQINLTDEESRIMPVAGGGFEQAYNAQAAVDTNTMLVLATGVTQAPNDKEQVRPMLTAVQAKATAEVIGPVAALIADCGYYSENNVQACEAANIEPLIAVARENHHPDWRERHTEPAPLPATATGAEKMAHQLRTRAGRATYALRKQTVEPVFGIIKSVLGFRKFSMRGLAKASGEWTLVCLAWNLKRMAVLRLQ